MHQNFHSLRRDIQELKSTLSRQQNKEPFWRQPAIITAILGVMATLATSVWQLTASRELERERLRSSLIQEASKSQDPEKTLRNLKFLVKAGLIPDEDGLISNLTLEEVPSFSVALFTPTRQTRPLSVVSLKAIFGDPLLSEGDKTGMAKADPKWVSENLVEVSLPQLVGIRGFPKSGKVRFHKIAAPHLKAAIEEIEQKGLLSRIISWDGSWMPRFVRGSRTHYSVHAFGIAFDINFEANKLGMKPADAGTPGSVRELVPIFQKHGFFWGGDNMGLPDGMSFQYGVEQEEE